MTGQETYIAVAHHCGSVWKECVCVRVCVCVCVCPNHTAAFPDTLSPLKQTTWLVSFLPSRAQMLFEKVCRSFRLTLWWIFIDVWHCSSPCLTLNNTTLTPMQKTEFGIEPNSGLWPTKTKPTNQPTTQETKKPLKNQPTKKSINQPSERPTKQPTQKTTNQPTKSTNKHNYDYFLPFPPADPTEFCSLHLKCLIGSWSLPKRCRNSTTISSSEQRWWVILILVHLVISHIHFLGI